MIADTLPTKLRRAVSPYTGIVRSLLGEPTFEVDAHPAVWASATHDAERDRVVVSLLHYPGDLPVLPTTARLRITPPTGRRFTGLLAAPSGRAVEYSTASGGAVQCDIDIDRLALVVCSYE